MQLEAGHAEAVDKADDTADDQNSQQCHGNGHYLQAGEQLVGSQLQTGCNSSSQTDLTTGRNIGTSQDDAAADTQCDGQLGHGQVDDVNDGCHGQELGFLNPDEDNCDTDDDEHCVIHQQVANSSVSVLGGHSLQFINLGRLLNFQIRHVYFLLKQTWQQES